VLLEGTYKNHLVQLPEHFRADQELKHIIKGMVRMPFLPSKALDTCVRQQNEMPFTMGCAALTSFCSKDQILLQSCGGIAVIQFLQ